MATVAVSRPTQALRQRRADVPRLSLSKRSVISTGADGESMPPTKKRRVESLDEPYVRDNAYILKKHQGKQPSLVIHLHDGYWKFAGQEGSYRYDDRMRSVLQHLRRQTVPHEIIGELLAEGVTWYDGCLIVEVHNHKTVGGKQQTSARSQEDGDNKFSMHRWNAHITPSSFVPFPKKASLDDESEQAEAEAQRAKEKSRGQNKDGPQVFTVVLHPTDQSRHRELLLLTSTPASDLRSSKKKPGADVSSNGQPATPSEAIPQTPMTTSNGPLSASQKMALEDGDLYTFQGDLLMVTEPPLFLEPVNNPQDAQRVLDMLSNPLHQEQPPSPKTRKKTTAQMAADDAQAAEAERRMLIMDERIKPSTRTGAGTAGESNEGTAASLSFSRFKTIEIARATQEENERVRKEKDAREALEKKQLDEQNNARQQVQLAQQEQRRQNAIAQQQTMAAQGNNTVQQRQALLRAQQAEQQRQAQAAMTTQHAHPNAHPQALLQAQQQQQQANFQHPGQNTAMQGSPIQRQQTPGGLLNSSPMLPQNGFPTAQTSSQGAGSPQRPTTGAQNRGVQMARQVSQQHGNSQSGTPQLAQGTPNMVQAMPRQISQTPRLQPGSPAVGMQGTPISAGSMGMNMANAQMMNGNTPFTQEQLLLLQQQQQRHLQQQAGHVTGVNGQVQGANLTPHDIQNIRLQQQQKRFAILHAQAQQAQVTGVPMDPQAHQAYMQMRVNMQHQQQQASQAQQMRNTAQQQHMAQMQLQQQMQMNQRNAAAASMHPQATPQMAHAHPQTPQSQHNLQQQQQHNGGINNPADLAALKTQQSVLQAQQRANQIANQRQQQANNQASMHLRSLHQQWSGLQNVPQQVVDGLPPHIQLLLRQQVHKQMLQRQQQLQQLQQGGGGGAGAGGGGGASAGNEGQVPASAPNPAYMAQLRNNRVLLQQQMAQQQQQQQQQHAQQQQQGMVQQQQGQGQGQGGDVLDRHFASMAEALQRSGAGQ
ncbi:hypothetical protein LTR62_005813 [Meristemomyces frigidus]|uniref:Spt20-like SEP domain-containing protein n=1 Tax=Meristemomyces frigidus TaxID=1508187 RepID=A0AAN7TCP7_9PEZI|nr:hypothetical protein LTR62_005813 [Meristemomyces frigidus]